MNAAVIFLGNKRVKNVKKKAKTVHRPYGQSFHAVQILKESYDDKDPFLIYEADEGQTTGLPYVIKSSKRKLEVMENLDCTGDHSLNQTVVHLDVIHGRTKEFKTYTLSYYDTRLMMMIVLCVMDTISECKEACTLFFKKINEMLNKFVSQRDPNSPRKKPYKFNPFHIKDDEHGGNKIGMANVFGKPD